MTKSAGQQQQQYEAFPTPQMGMQIFFQLTFTERLQKSNYYALFVKVERQNLLLFVWNIKTETTTVWTWAMGMVDVHMIIDNVQQHYKTAKASDIK